MKQTYCLIIIALLFAANADAQLFTDQGIFSGSGLTVVPTATIVPSSEFRLQFTRFDHLRQGKGGANIVGLSCGLSTTLEGYIRTSGEQTGSALSSISYSFGGKFRFPALIPVIRRLALWVESTNSDMVPKSAVFPSDAIRYGAIATFDSNGIHPTLLLGLSRMANRTRPLVGAGVTIATSNTSQVGFELIHGYLSSTSFQVVASGSIRVFPNVSLHLNPGYLSTSTLSSWIVSLGISCSTADIDFHPVTEVQVNDEFQLPSIEDIEKQSSEEKNNE